MMIPTRYLAAALLAALIGASPARAADPASPPPGVIADVPPPAQPHLTLYKPRADVLKDGYVYLAFRVDNLRILPLYTDIHGKAATSLTPRIGHLHVFVDDSKWSWIHAQNDAIYFGALPPGPHRVRVDLVDASHATIETKTVHFVVP
ncbi:DUF6130 family protein [Burkholderia sp. Ac-20379]|uniref:DUF6130 family protein n=1 Tax=Burkholderia sp. Ac-20379 TaxID=2703900 RepID=UPI0019813323|nr:DUF6130 family protein [Burkholderia sp. Ac-20379]MBN3723356.1 hypothetical protein [Burkholderia sp. Ac-20379]